MNPHRGEVDLELGGETVTLRFTWQALIDLQRMTGKTVQQLFGASGLLFGPSEIAAVIAAGLRHVDRKITPERVAEKLDPAKFTYYIETVGQGLAAALGVGEKTGEKVEEDADAEPHPSRPTLLTGNG